MKVESYAVAMNAQYFNLQQDYTEAKLSTIAEEFSSDNSSTVSKVEVDLQQVNDTTRELSTELSKAILKNIDSQENRLVSDRVEMSYYYNEVQALNYQVKAYIKADNKEIELSLDVSLSRSFTQKTNITIESLRALKDPLVISLDGTMPSLSSKTFAFDIDSDGESDQISELNAGNGFLALDKNNNGVIDNGNELFGTKSGDGFADLTIYDEDKNGWIDENDAIFNKLRIWQKTDSEDKLIGLGEVGIGAIFLGRTQTPFSLKSDSNRELGEMLTSGLFVYEDGRAGVISQIDLVVNQETKNDLSKIDNLQKGMASLKLDNIYKQGVQESESEDSGDKRIEKLQKQLKNLEHKLSTATQEDKPPLQAQIGLVFSQMMAILAEEFS